MTSEENELKELKTIHILQMADEIVETLNATILTFDNVVELGKEKKADLEPAYSAEHRIRSLEDKLIVALGMSRSLRDRAKDIMSALSYQ